MQYMNITCMGSKKEHPEYIKQMQCQKKKKVTGLDLQ